MCLSFLLYCASAAALDPNQPIGQLFHYSWTAKDGLTGGVQTLAQTPDGFLWLGTTDGLIRFDGVSFEHYKPEVGSLPAAFVKTLLAAPNGDLWIGYFRGGVSLLRNGRLINYTERDGLPTGTVRKLAQEPDGTTWAAVVGGLARFNGQRWQYISKNWNFPAKSPSTVAVDDAGTVWACAWYEGVFYLRKGERQFRQVGFSPVPGPGPEFAKASNGAMWLWTPTTSAISRFAQPPVLAAGSLPKPPKADGTLIIDRDGSGWMVTVDDGIRRIPVSERFLATQLLDSQPGVERFSRKDGLSDHSANTLFQDREGNVWVGTDRGLDRFRRRNVLWTSLERASIDGSKLTARSGGDIWAGYAQALIDVRGHSIVRGGPGWTDFMYRDSDGSLWFWGGDGNSKCLWHWTGGSFHKVALPYATAVKAMARDGSSHLWVSILGQGVFQQTGDGWNLVEILKGQPDMTAFAALGDSEGRVWLSYPERKVVALWDNGRIQVFSSENGLKIGAVSVLAGRGQAIWAGGEQGLAYFANGNFRTLKPADSQDFGNVGGIVDTTAQGLWFSNATGIIHVPKDELQSALQHPGHKVRYESFDLISDLTETPQANIQSSPAVEGSDGILWFGTPNGVLRVDPSHIYRNPLAPGIAIRSLEANRKSYPVHAALTLPPHTRNLRIDYSVLSLSIPERVRSRYRLEGSDQDWQDGGARGQDTFNNLGPGTYTFHVVGCNNDGVWKRAGPLLTFTIQPAFYQTAWFQFLYVLAVAGVIWCLYRLRLRQMTARVKMRYSERLAERTRIARELHDTLLQSLAGVSLQLDGISKQAATAPGKTVSLISHVREQVDATFREARIKVWNLRSPTLEEQGLAAALQEFYERVGPVSAAACEFRLIGQPRPCPPEVEEEILRIAQEATNNAVRHGRANRIRLVLEYAEKSLKLCVSDDGQGFDLEEGYRKSGHMGLKNMQERAAQILGKCRIITAPGRGTQIEVRVPLSS
jgi:signal transduction histidine kinase/ligand-binding sensor domain-containing protein